MVVPPVRVPEPISTPVPLIAVKLPPTVGPQSRSALGLLIRAGLSGSVAFQRMNADSLDDMILYLWSSNGGIGESHDSTRALLIFGQEGLDTLDMLDIGAMDGFQSSPFIAMEMRKGSELVNPAIRDISGVLSYILAPVSLDLAPFRHDGDHAAGVSPSNGASSATPLHLRVFPNPTAAAAKLSVESMPGGTYEVEIVSINGLVAHRQHVNVPTSGSLLETLDLSSLASGYYIVRLHGRSGSLGAYPVIITR